MDIQRLFEKLWNDYQALNPQAAKIHQLLEARGEKVINDHVAFRGFEGRRAGIEALSQVFLASGYTKGQDYEFEQKKLRAIHLDPPRSDLPKVFVSELKTSEFSDFVKQKVSACIEAMPAGIEKQEDFCVSGRPWPITSSDYETLAQESEYAAWMAAFGFRANHFTVSINELKSFQEVGELNQFLKDNRFELNTSGGEIKGSPQELLEQSSTLAARIEWEFSDQKVSVPSCYYEFAKRYPDSSGKLYGGFVAASADKIFESTDR